MLLRYFLTKIYILVVFLFNLSHHSEFKYLLLKHKKMQLTSEAISPISAVPDDLIATSFEAFQLFCPRKHFAEISHVTIEQNVGCFYIFYNAMLSSSVYVITRR